MSIFRRIRRLFRRKRAAPLTVEPPAVSPMRKLVMSYEALARFASPEGMQQTGRSHQPPQVMPGVIPQAEKLAQDSANQAIYDYANDVAGGVGFLGYQFLAELMQRPEYRKITETIAQEMCRKWIQWEAAGETDKTKRIKELTDEFKRLNVRDVFLRATEHDGAYGRGQIFMDIETADGVPTWDNPAELETILVRDKAKITKGSLVGLRTVEPMWTYPNRYNSTNPLAPDFYKPAEWFVMGKRVHKSRLLTFVGREVPDMFKPSYNFGGLSASQLAIPYVENFIRTRDSVGDMIHSFSTSGIKTDMDAVLSGGDGADIFTRLEMYNRMRDNKGALVLDKNTEDFFQFNTPLSGLDALQAQSQEQICSVSNIPLVKYTGITPSGLNASSDGEIRVWYDWTHSEQERRWTVNLTLITDVVMLSLWGEIDPDIHFKYVPLYELDGEALARNRKTDGDRDVGYIQNGVLSQEEVRAKLAADPESGYSGITVADVPEMSETEPPPGEEGSEDGGGDGDNA